MKLVALALLAAGAQAMTDADRAQGLWNELRAHDYAAATARFDDAMKAALDAEKLAATVQQLEAGGPLGESKVLREEKHGAFNVITLRAAASGMQLDVTVALNSTGHVSGLHFKPAPDQPAAGSAPALPDGLREAAVTVKTGRFELPGLLTLPAKASPSSKVSAIALVHGSGPQDSDETLGALKPFRDLAWGLAQKGIAVLRYEKRSHKYGAQMADDPARITVEDETIADAVSALQLLRARPEIDAARVFVLGHSLGAMLVPRIAARDGQLAGEVLLAPAARPLDEVIADQLAYVTKLKPPEGERKAAIDKVLAELARVKTLTDADRGTSALYMGAPASYWLDLNAYHPAEAAKALRGPLLVARGSRDYHVSERDLALFREALAGRKDAQVKTYAGLNHLFVRGEGTPGPDEYGRPGHVDAQVIADIAALVAARGR